MRRHAAQWSSGHVVTVAAAVTIGTVLRLDQITRQIVADDEWHALQTAMYQSYRYVFTHFGMADHSIPLTLAYKLLLDGGGLSEMFVRAPPLLFGLAALIVAPVLAKPAGPAVAGLMAVLLAVSPLHVYFSRYARPYALTMLLTFVSSVALYRWWCGASRRWMIGHAIASAAAVWLHLTAAPAVVASWLWALGTKLARAHNARGYRELAVVVLADAVLAGALVMPAMIVDHAAIATRAGDPVPFDRHTFSGAGRLIAGTDNGWIVMAMLAGYALGALRLARQRPAFLGLGVTVIATQLAAVLAGRPAASQIPIVFARYLLPALPWLLLMAAAGITALVEPVTRRKAVLGAGISVVIGGVLLGTGPLPTIHYRPNNWTNHALFQYSYGLEDPHTAQYRLAPPTISPFYAQMAKEPPGSLTLLEAPWHLDWTSNVYPFYQRVHRQWMKVGFVRPPEDHASGPMYNELPWRHATGFRNFVHVGDYDALAARGVDYVVFHTDLNAELPYRLPRPRLSATQWVERYRRRYGRPVYRDDQIVVFAVGRQPAKQD